MSIRGFVVASIIACLGIVVDVQRLGGRDGALMVMATVLVLAFNGAIDIVLHRTRWAERREQPVRAAEVLARLGFSGTCFAIAYSVLRTAFGVTMPIGLVEGFVIYPLISVWVGSSVVVYLDVVDQARRIRRRAVQERSRSIDIVQRADSTVAELRRRVAAALAPGIERVRSVAEVGAGSPKVVPDAIRSEVDRSMRGVGRDLWRRADGAAARIGPLEVLRGLLARPTFRPWPIIGLAVVMPLVEDPELIRTWAVLVAVLVALAVYVECTIANRLSATIPRWRPVVVVSVITVFVAQAEVIDRVGETWGQPADSPGLVVVILFTLVLVALTSALGSYRDLDDARAEALAADMHADRLAAAAHALAVSEESRRLAALLHGRLQSRLLGCAMAIEFAGNDPVAIRAALDRTLAVLDEGWHDAEGAHTSPITAVVASWSGLADVHVAGVESVPGSLADDAAIVVEELVANAVRHGRAGRVDVTIAGTDDGCSITVVDDGTVGGQQNRPGLGSAVLERAGTVERSPGPGGWTVTVRLRGA